MAAALALPACLPSGQYAAVDVDSGAIDVDEANPVYDVSVRLSDTMATVAIVEWKTRSPSTGSVRFGTDSYTAETPAESAPRTDHRHILLGLKAQTEYQTQIGVRVDGVAHTHDAPSITTGALPALLPALTTEHTTTPGPGGFALLPTLSPEGSPASVVIIDADGDYVWYAELPEFSAPTSAAFSADMQSIRYTSNDDLVTLDLEGVPQDTLWIPAGHHDHTELPNGTLATLNYDWIEVNGEEYRGDSILEIAPDGGQSEAWRAYDDADALSLIDPDEPTQPGLGMTHANSLEYQSDDGAYYVNLAALKAVVKVDQETGALVRVFDGSGLLDDDGALNLSFNPTVPYGMTHQVEPTDTGFLLFVNFTRDSDCSRVVEITVDEVNMVATERMLYDGDECLTVFGLGGIQRLSHGGDMVIWSTAGRMDLYSASGERSSKTMAAFGYGFGYGQHVYDLYTPQNSLAAAD